MNLPIPTHEQLAYFLTHPDETEAVKGLRRRRTNGLQQEDPSAILDSISDRCSRTTQGDLTMQAIDNILKGDN